MLAQGSSNGYFKTQSSADPWPKAAGYFRLSNSLFDCVQVSATDKLIFSALCRHANKAGQCWPSINLLAAKCGLSRRTIVSGIAHMRAVRLIAVTPRKVRVRNKPQARGNLYTILLKPEPRKKKAPNEVQPLHLVERNEVQRLHPKDPQKEKGNLPPSSLPPKAGGNFSIAKWESREHASFKSYKSKEWTPIRDLIPENGIPPPAPLLAAVETLSLSDRHASAKRRTDEAAREIAKRGERFAAVLQIIEDFRRRNIREFYLLEGLNELETERQTNGVQSAQGLLTKILTRNLEAQQAEQDAQKRHLARESTWKDKMKRAGEERDACFAQHGAVDLAAMFRAARRGDLPRGILSKSAPFPSRRQTPHERRDHPRRRGRCHPAPG